MRLDAVASLRGGRVVSATYVNGHTKLQFEDAGHNLFWATPASVFSGRWSPYEGRIGEQVCRLAIEYLLKAEFPTRWDIARRPNGNKLQLDGYNEALNVAFEYQGYLHQTDAGVRARDAEKRESCRSQEIILVEVEEFPSGKAKDPFWVAGRVALAIRKAFLDWGRVLPPLQFEGFEIDLTRLNHGLRGLREMSRIAASLGGRLVSKVYYGADIKLLFEDAAGNSFEMRPMAVKQGHWSPFEYGNARDVFRRYAELQAVARAHGGRVISAAYTNARTKMLFEDSSGNRWRALPGQILRKNQWSPYESNNHIDVATHLSELQIISMKRGGCLSSASYQCSQAKLDFIDVAGNSFSASANSIKNGSWSPAESKGSWKSDRYLNVFSTSSAIQLAYTFDRDGSKRIIKMMRHDLGILARWNWVSETSAEVEISDWVECADDEERSDWIVRGLVTVTQYQPFNLGRCVYKIPRGPLDDIGHSVDSESRLDAHYHETAAPRLSAL